MTDFWTSLHINGFFLTFCLLISIYFSVLSSLRKWDIKDRIPFILYFMVFALWSGISLIELKNTYIQNLFTLVFFILAASAKFLISLSISSKQKWKISWLTVFILVFPAVTAVLYLQDLNPNDLQILLIKSNSTVFSGGWLVIILFYVLPITLYSFFSLLKTLFPSDSKLVTYYWGVLHATMPTAWILIVESRNILSLNTLPIDVIYPAEVISLFFVAAAISVRFIHNDVNRVEIIETMPNGWILIDEDEKIIDLNAEAANILGASKDQILNLSFKKFDLDIPLSSNGQENPGVSLNLKKSFRKRDELRYYNVQIRPVTPDAQRKWKLLFWTDTTNQKLSENSRQAARDEMFVLLNAVSSEASHAASLSEFLDGAIYQLIFSFRTQAAIVYLLSNIENGVSFDTKIYKPMSVFGVQQDTLGNIQIIDKEYEFFNKDTDSDQEPVLIENPASDQRLPATLRSGNFDSVLFLPLTIRHTNEPNIIGGMFLARKEKPIYTNGEILRLSALSDHIANLVDDERRRKLAIAFSERQRLMRDLHDSVSQKLYGLVTLTEAAQAIIETGGEFDPQNMMARIGDNARQAVREMRLFLHQMQVVEIEKEGFISALHHRLAAVEGRADIKAGLIADETIKLLPDVEIALYYIAQEALNNVLRHAKASKVVVTFKQTKKNILLRITDDGKGFDVKNVDQTGLGLSSMRDRTEKINGKFKITSEVGEGTVVTVTIPKHINRI